ncbi:MAG: PstS family phosphate ABC transporter substrate-binding protein [Planctomycetes bacterium]|nr:PstS family phosphate ABC transporter substrate-binding protein [Planctomycetota bacterium]
MFQTRGLFGAAFALSLITPFAFAQSKVDPKLPSYVKTSGVSGNIKSVGSDTMNNLMALWAEGFQKQYPNVQVEIEGKGSGTAPPALIAGTASFGPMSRKIKDKEADEFEKEFGYKPTQIGTSIDMLAVFVHKDNPIAKTGLTLAQIDAIFSKNRKGGFKEDITTWGQLGLTGEWANKPISLYGRNSASGTYGYFKKKALFEGDYKSEVKEQGGSAAVVQGVANDKFAIGYSGIGYRTADVAVVPLAKDGDDFIAPSAKTASEYPLSRFLYLTVNHKPNDQLDPLRREFLRYVFSREGQLVVVKDGYLPLPFSICQKQLAMVGIDLEPAAVKEPAEAGMRK